MTFLQGRGEILKLSLRHWTTRAVCCKRLGMRIKNKRSFDQLAMKHVRIASMATHLYRQLHMNVQVY